jgi:hypothetical protein
MEKGRSFGWRQSSDVKEERNDNRANSWRMAAIS